MTSPAALDRARAVLDQPPPKVPAGQLAVPIGPRIGSLCTGYGGLDMAVQQVLGGTLAWVADPDPGAAAILTHHHPDVPNYGDITALDWADVEPVDVLCGGYPCQPFSVAGLRKGTADERHIWPFIACALRVLRPRLAVFENVANHLRLGFDTVLGDLAALGFDAEWCLVRASEIGAPHRRERLFLLAWPADTEGPRLEGDRLPGRPAERGARPAADPADLGHQWGGRARDGRPGPANRGGAAADADRDAVRQQPVGELGGGRTTVAQLTRPDVAADTASGCGPHEPGGDHRVEQFPQPGTGRGAGPGNHAPGTGGDHPAAVLDWGRYGPAVARWEATLGRRGPWATDARGRLNPPFVEWMQGLPAGHVTDPAIWQGWRPKTARNAQLKALGNGVVPAQAAAALRLLLDRAEAAR